MCDGVQEALTKVFALRTLRPHATYAPHPAPQGGTVSWYREETHFPPLKSTGRLPSSVGFGRILPAATRLRPRRTLGSATAFGIATAPAPPTLARAPTLRPLRRCRLDDDYYYHVHRHRHDRHHY